MRALASLFALAFAAATVGAQTQSTVAVVKVGSVSIRSGPSEQMAICGTLEQGAEVIAHHAEGDWWAIQPPVGSLIEKALVISLLSSGQRYLSFCSLVP